MFRVISCVLTSIVLLLVVSVAAQAQFTVDGSIFSDDFPGSALSGWDTSVFYGPGTTQTVHDSLLDQNTPVSGENYVTKILTFPDTSSWAGEVRFQVPSGATLSTPVAGTGSYEIFTMNASGWGHAGAAMNLREDGSGASGSTYSLLYSPEYTYVATLNKGQFYTAAVDRKSDDTVDIYLDGVFMGTEDAWGPSTIADFILVGDGRSGDVSGQVQFDWVKVGVPLPPPPGDADGDYDVDADDAAIVAANWQQTIGGGASVGDFNGDGDVNDIDATIMAANWGVGTAAAVPEPSVAFGLLILGLAALAAVNRRRS